MVEETAGSTVPRRQLGRYLTELREEAGISMGAAAELLHCSRTKVWRMEKGLVPMRGPDVTVLCDRYQADPELREVLLGLARETRSKGWWHAYGDAIPEWFSLYVGLESAAARLRLYHAELIPGLLQTREFIAALYALNRPEAPETERDRTIAVRMQRQRLLVRRLPPAPEVEVTISEAVLRRPVPDRAVWLDQLGHLRDISFLPNLVLRVLPLAAGPPLAAEAGTFTLLDFPPPNGRGPAEPATVYCESITGALYLDRPAEFAAYEQVWRGLEQAALDAKQSRQLIEAIMKEPG